MYGSYKYLGNAIAWNEGRIGKRCIWRNVCLFAAGGKALLFHLARCPALSKITLG